MLKSNKTLFFLTFYIFLLLTQYTQSQENNFLLNSNFSLENIKIFLENGGDVNLKDKNGATVLMWAAYKGNIDAVKFLVNKGADPSQKGTIYKDTLGSSYGSLLTIAAGEGNLDLLKYLIEEIEIDVNDREFNPNDSTESGWTALHWAVWTKNLDCINYLIDVEATNVNIKDNFGFTPLLYAVKYSYDSIVNLLLTNPNIDVNVQDTIGWSPLHYKSIVKDTSTINELITNKNTNVNIRDNYGFTPLHYAAFINNTGVVNILLKNKNIEINIKDNFESTPLHHSVSNNSINSTKLLLQGENINVNVKNNIGCTPLHYAIMNNNDTIVELLLSNQNIDVNVKNNDGLTPLHTAVINKNAEIVKILMKDKNIDLNRRDSFGWTPLSHAVFIDDIEMLYVLLNNKNIDINTQDTLKWTPLHHAANGNNCNITNLLLQNKNIDVNIKNNIGHTPLHYAVENKNDTLVSLLLSNPNIDVNVKNNNRLTPLHIAVNNNDAKIVSDLLTNKNINLNIRGSFGFTPLHCAVFYDNAEIVNILLNNKKIELNIQDTLNWTPLHHAVSKNNLNITKLLLQNKNIDVNIKNNIGYTPLHYAVENNNGTIVDLLLSNPNIDVNVKNNDGLTPLHIAVYNKSVEIVKKLMTNKSINLNIRDSFGWTPLQYAIIWRNDSIIDILLKSQNINVNIQDNLGCTPLYYAITRNEYEIISLLLQNNADIKIEYESGNSVLHYAAKTCDKKVVELLVEYSSNIDIINNYNETPLVCAIESNNYDNVEFLLNKGANPYHYKCWDFDDSSEFKTYLNFEKAVNNHNIKILNLLFSYATNDSLNNEIICNLLNNESVENDERIFDYLLGKLKKYSCEGISRFILDQSEDIDILNKIINHDPDFIYYKDKFSNSPLFYAAYYNNFNAVLFLLDLGADKNNIGYNGNTVINVCMANGLILMEKYISEYPNMCLPDTLFYDYKTILPYYEYDTITYCNLFLKAIDELSREIDINSYWYYIQFNSLTSVLNEEILKRDKQCVNIIGNIIESTRKHYMEYDALFHCGDPCLLMANIYLHENFDSSSKFLDLLINVPDVNYNFFNTEACMIKANYYYEINMDSALYYYDKVIKNSLPSDDLFWEAKILSLTNQDNFETFSEFSDLFYDGTFVNSPKSIIEYKFMLDSKLFSYVYRKNKEKDIDIRVDELYKHIIKSKSSELVSIKRQKEYMVNAHDTYLINLLSEKNQIVSQIYKLEAIGDNISVIETKKLEELKIRLLDIETIIELNIPTKQYTNSNISISTVDKIQNNLSINEAIIEFFIFRLTDSVYFNSPTDSIIYAAIIMRPGQNLQLIPLFEKNDLDRIIKKEEGSSDKNHISALYSNNGEELYKLIWEPILPYLDSVDNIYLSPSGALYNVAFNAIPTGQDSVLGDKYKFRYYMNSSSILEDNTIALENITVYYDINYNSLDTAKNNALPQLDFLAESQKSEISDIYANEKSASQNLKPFSHSKYLPDSIFNEYKVKDINVKLFNGSNATKRQFLGLSGIQQSIIHFDTHGKYVSHNEKDHYSESYRIYKHSNPMYRSYLAMAGINDTITVGNEAILTAYEISNIDLSNTELVVLSACETAKGDILGNEGVYGLLRGFKIAGVNYIIASLWSVDAEASYEFMKLFYNILFETYLTNDRLDINNIFTETQNRMRHNPKYSSPYYWAAYILIK